jgi:hypothetical protein
MQQKRECASVSDVHNTEQCGEDYTQKSYRTRENVSNDSVSTEQDVPETEDESPTAI